MTNFKKNILLTGAGFTANFGAPLAKEMWSKLLNNPKMASLEKIREKLLSDFDFENVYSEVLNDENISEEEKKSFQTMMTDTYSDMDETLKSYVNSGFTGQGSRCDWAQVNKFLSFFINDTLPTEIGAHFTLNQDILIERARAYIPLGITVRRNREYLDNYSNGQIKTNQKITLPNIDELEKFKREELSSNPNYYIKLHGSHGWLSYSGSDQMIIGKNKEEDIEKEPILKWYFELFEEALNRDGVNLFVLGYSFRDQHINDIIIKAIAEHKIKIFIISPEDPEDLKYRLERNESREPSAGGITSVFDMHNAKIWPAVTGYFPYKLSDIFPTNGSETQVSKQLRDILSSSI